METILVVSIFKVTGKWTSLYALLTFDPGLESSHVRENKREQLSHRPSSYQLEDEALVLDTNNKEKTGVQGFTPANRKRPCKTLKVTLFYFSIT
jgi:hypothetical protein